MQKLLLNHLSKKGLKLSSSKTFINSKVVFILNDQIDRFLRQPSDLALIDFIFQNANKNQGGNLTKTSDFFSRLLKCLFSMRTQVPEMDLLLGLLCTGIGEAHLKEVKKALENNKASDERSGIRRKNTLNEIKKNEDFLKKIISSNSKKVVRNYSILRKQILELKSLEASSKHMLATIEIRDSEIRDLLRFYKLRMIDFLKFIQKFFPQMLPENVKKLKSEVRLISIKADCFILFLVFHSSLSTLRSAQFAPPSGKNTSTRTIASEKSKFSKIVFKTKIRRGLLKLRVVAMFLVGLRRKQYKNDIKWFKAKLDNSKKKLLEKVYFKEETLGNVKDVLVQFAGMKKKSGLVQFEHGRIVKAVQASWESFHEWVKNILGIGLKQIEEHQKRGVMELGIKNKLIHLVQLLHLKTNADIRKIEKDLKLFEKNFSSDLHYSIQSYMVDIYIYDYLKRELLNAYKKILPKSPNEYAREKFYKDGKLDRETIGRLNQRSSRKR